jgi:hypothetical protein
MARLTNSSASTVLSRTGEFSIGLTKEAGSILTSRWKHYVPKTNIFNSDYAGCRKPYPRVVRALPVHSTGRLNDLFLDLGHEFLGLSAYAINDLSPIGVCYFRCDDFRITVAFASVINLAPVIMANGVTIHFAFLRRELSLFHEFGDFLFVIVHNNLTGRRLAQGG